MSPFARELIDRAWKTAVQFVLGSTVLASFMESLAQGELVINASAWGALAYATLGAVLSVLFSGVSRLVGDNTANLAPAKLEQGSDGVYREQNG